MKCGDESTSDKGAANTLSQAHRKSKDKCRKVILRWTAASPAMPIKKHRCRTETSAFKLSELPPGIVSRGISTAPSRKKDLVGRHVVRTSFLRSRAWRSDRKYPLSSGQGFPYIPCNQGCATPIWAHSRALLVRLPESCARIGNHSTNLL